MPLAQASKQKGYLALIYEYRKGYQFVLIRSYLDVNLVDCHYHFISYSKDVSV